MIVNSLSRETCEFILFIRLVWELFFHLLSCLLKDFSNKIPSKVISYKTTQPSSVPTATLVSDLFLVMHQIAPPIEGTSFLAVNRTKSYRTMKPSKPPDKSWDLHHKITSTWRSDAGTITSNNKWDQIRTR